MRVDIYRNLHKDCYSIRHKGLVVGHAKQVIIHNPEFVVSEKGRDKVRAERRKNVHAVIRGELVGVGEETILPTGPTVTYNPYTHDLFESNGTPILEHDGYAILNEGFDVRLA